MYALSTGEREKFSGKILDFSIRHKNYIIQAAQIHNRKTRAHDMPTQ